MSAKGSDYIWKIVVGGAGGVGKTTIIHRYIKNEFISDTKLTVGVQFQTIFAERAGRKISMILWDLGGQQRFRFVQPGYVKGSVGAFVLYDMGRYETLLETPEWIDMFKSNCDHGTPIILVGTKYDTLPSDDDAKQIMADAESIKEKFGLVAHVVTSAKLGYNVTETMEYLIDYLLFQETSRNT